MKRTMIEFQNLLKKFGAHTVLNGINLKVYEGEILFILGISGTGKSVLLKNIVGLMRPDAGSVWIEGKEVSQYSEEKYFEVRKSCGMVFQQPALFDSLNIYENVAFGLRRHYKMSEAEIAERILQSLNLVQLNGIEAKFPYQISYGMQKRVSLARTIALRPKILLFDEPTTGLDPITTNSISKLILDLSRKLKTTSVVVSHDMKVAFEIADRIVVLDQGKVVESGTPEDLKKSQQPIVVDFLGEINS